MPASASPSNCFSRLKDSRKVPGSRWKREGRAEDVLRTKLEDLYWEGVKNELEVILRTLERLQNSEGGYFKLWQEMEKSGETVSGYETFVDQVCPRSRDFARRYGKLRSFCEKGSELGVGDRISFTKLAEKTQQESRDLKREIQRAAVLGREKDDELTPIERLAKVLLRSAGFLDVEKIIEHRPPLEKLSFWKRPAVPQLTARRARGQLVPRFKPRTCSDCGKIIHGCMFGKRDRSGQDRKLNSRYLSCENCYRHRPGHYDNRKFFKMYKHCILKDAIDPITSLHMCKCGPVPGVNASRVPSCLYPVRPEEHLPSCALLALTKDVAQAKQNFLRGYKGRSRAARLKKLTTMLRSWVGSSKTKENKKETREEPKNVMEENSDEEVDTDAKSIYLTSETGILDAEEAEKDIPRRVRRYTRRYPFGNVHMALRVGPIVIENGVPNTKGGALLSARQPSRFFQAVKMPQQPRSLAVAGKVPRNVYSSPAEETGLAPKRTKAVLKQVVGTPFTGLSDQDEEREILKLLVEASTKGWFAHPAYSATEQRSLLNEALGPLLGAVKELMESRVQCYLDFLSERLLSSDTKLRWNRRNNNCQNFCDALLSKGPFVSLFPETNTGQPDPLYLISFVCRPEAYLSKTAKTKLDVPHGLTEEYLLKFHFGLHEESDMIDTLQEYWHDFGGFGKHLYRFQDMFPWDCTEAFSSDSVTCSDCSLSKHVWAFPFDSWSIISLHFRRDRCLYPPDPISNTELSDIDWIRTRLTLLKAEEYLTAGAAAMASKHSIRQAIQGPLESCEPQEDRWRLGGIHRAQPWSHCYEGGEYRIHFIAEWAHLGAEEQVARYELLRDYRREMPDMGVAPPNASLTGSRYESVRPGTFGARLDWVLAFEAQISFAEASFDGPQETCSDGPAGANGADEPAGCDSSGGGAHLDPGTQYSAKDTSTDALVHGTDSTDHGGGTTEPLSGTEAGKIIGQYYQQQSHDEDREWSMRDMHSAHVPGRTGRSLEGHSSSHRGGGGEGSGRRWDDHYPTSHSYGDRDRSRHDHYSNRSHGGGGKSRYDHSSSHSYGGGSGGGGGGGGGHYSSSDTGGYSGGGGGGGMDW